MKKNRSISSRLNPFWDFQCHESKPQAKGNKKTGGYLTPCLGGGRAIPMGVCQDCGNPLRICSTDLAWKMPKEEGIWCECIVGIRRRKSESYSDYRKRVLTKAQLQRFRRMMSRSEWY